MTYALLEVFHPAQRRFRWLGLLFALIIGIYWTWGTIKEAFFVDMVGAAYLPIAKTASFFLLLPLLSMYQFLLKRFAGTATLYILLSFYGCIGIGAGIFLINHDGVHLASGWGLSSIVIYILYAVIESFGSLMVALFWGLVVDATQPDQGKKGFPLIVACGQIGGIIGPFFLTRLPRWCNLKTQGISILIATGMMGIIALVYAYIQRLGWLNTAAGYKPQEAQEERTLTTAHALSLLWNSWYLIGLTICVGAFEITTQIIDFYFRYRSNQVYSRLDLHEYFGLYGAVANGLTFIFLALGIEQFSLFKNPFSLLILTPLAALLGLISMAVTQQVHFLFVFLALAKACHFAFSIPTLKQLYIPTTQTVRYGVQAWIDTAFSRFARLTSGCYGMLLLLLSFFLAAAVAVQLHIYMGAFIGLGAVLAWIYAAYYLAKTYQQALAENRLIE
jgi:AAA family ATP:ADP antiporter